MSDLVGNTEDRFSRDAAHISKGMLHCYFNEGGYMIHVYLVAYIPL